MVFNLFFARPPLIEITFKEFGILKRFAPKREVSVRFKYDTAASEEGTGKIVFDNGGVSFPGYSYSDKEGDVIIVEKSGHMDEKEREFLVGKFGDPLQCSDRNGN